MRIDGWMKRAVHHVKPRDTVGHARVLLERFRINQLPVVVDGRLVGIVTDRDLRDAFPSALDAHRGHAKIENAPVEEVMSHKIVTLGPEDTMEEAARVMRRERIGAVPIVERERLIGLVTRSDVLDAFVALVEHGAAAAPAPGPRGGGR